MIDEKRFSKQAEPASHSLSLTDREKLNVTGVTDVDSFDDENIVLITTLGTLTVKGINLHINKLSVDSGDVTVEGEIISLAYSNSDSSGKGAGLFARMFR